METIVYDRTFEQNEELGINDMVLEGYEQDDQKVEIEPTVDAVSA
jgi:zinc finger protein